MKVVAGVGNKLKRHPSPSSTPPPTPLGL
jgi:hypothetical protein